MERVQFTDCVCNALQRTYFNLPYIYICPYMSIYLYVHVHMLAQHITHHVEHVNICAPVSEYGVTQSLTPDHIVTASIHGKKRHAIPTMPRVTPKRRSKVKLLVYFALIVSIPWRLPSKHLCPRILHQTKRYRNRNPPLLQLFLYLYQHNGSNMSNGCHVF